MCMRGKKEERKKDAKIFGVTTPPTVLKEIQNKDIALLETMVKTQQKEERSR